MERIKFGKGKPVPRDKFLRDIIENDLRDAFCFKECTVRRYCFGTERSNDAVYVIKDSPKSS